jgi:VWFA-related protein
MTQFTHKKFRREICRVTTLLLTLAACAAAPRAQTAQPSPAQQRPDEVVRVETELVQTDVTVFDRDGKFVEGLGREQFEVKVDGRVVPVVFFERAGTGSLKERTTAGAPPATTAARVSARGRRVAFFLDDVHLSADSLERVRKTIGQFVEREMMAGDSVLIATATGQLGFLQQFTDNRGVLRVALARLTYKPFNVRDSEQVPMTEYQALKVDAGDRDALTQFAAMLLAQTNPPAMPVGVGPPAGGSIYSKPSNGQQMGMTREQAERMVRERAQWILKQTSDYSLGTLSALENLVRGSAQFPGRKLVFFLSDGFYLNDRNTGFTDRLRQIADAALRSGVVIYSLDARGLVGDTDASSNRADQVGKLSRINSGELIASQDPLNALAADTGGRALFNSGRLDEGLHDALAETSNYYRLAWKPEAPEQKAGAFRRVEVSVVGRPELTVRLPRGYMASQAKPSAAGDAKTAKPGDGGAKSDAKSAEADLRAAFASGVAKTELPTALSTTYVDVPGKGPVLTSSVEVSTDALDYGADGHQPASVDIVGVVWNDQGKPAGNFKTRLNVTPIPPSAEGLRPGVIYNQPTPLAPGLYQVKVAARDARGGQTGSALQWIEIPDLSKRRLALSSLHLGGRVVGGADASKAGAAPQVQFSVSRRFARSTRLDFLAFIYNAARATGGVPVDLSAQVQVLRGGRAVVSAPARPLTPDQAADLTRIPFTGAVTLGQLPAGLYELEVTVTDNVSKATATERVAFEIL